MQASDYHLAELRFAYCYHVYVRWCTHRLVPHAPLAALDQPTLHGLVDRFQLHVLQCASEPKEVRTLVSLQPHEAVAAAASKLKGQASKWLRQALHLDQPANLFSKGYFACTTGKSTQEQVHAYLDDQAEHHGYSERVVVPVFVESYPPVDAEETCVRAKHAWTILRFHLVLAVWRRRGVFAVEEGQAVAARWQQLQATGRFVLQKVSFLPDHVHLAVRVHPSVLPAELVVELMNAAQRVVYEGFPQSVIRAGVERLWQPSAYVGSFGDLATPQVQAYLRNWKTEAGSGGRE